MKRKLLGMLITVCMTLALVPVPARASNNYHVKPKEGWYELRCMGNYVNIDANGEAELRDKTNTPEGNARFKVHFYGTGGYGLEMPDGRFLGVDMPESESTTGGKLDGWRVKALPYDIDKYMVRWDIYSENNNNLFSIRPRMRKDIFMNASGEKNSDGTHIITWTNVDRWVCGKYPCPDSPQHGEFRFVSVNDPSKPIPTYRVEPDAAPYRKTMDGEVLGDIPKGTILKVSSIEGDWAKVNYAGGTYFMWAAKLKETNGLAPTITATFNGAPITFDQPPVSQQGRTLVPLRAIFEAMGAMVEWNSATQTATATSDGTIVSLTIGSKILIKNGEQKTLDVPAQLIGGRTLVPARAVAEAFGAKVDWNNTTQTVIITK